MTEEKKLEDFLPNKNGSYYKKFELKNDVSLINKEEIIIILKGMNLLSNSVLWVFQIEENDHNQEYEFHSFL